MDFKLVTRDSDIKENKVNFLAVCETIFAIILFWYVFISFKSGYLLYVGILIAPLFFLKTNLSIKCGCIWFSSIFPDESKTRTWITTGALYVTLFAIFELDPSIFFNKSGVQYNVLSTLSIIYLVSIFWLLSSVIV
jgi:hypothetical protein